jgi:hypothetical protein
MLWIVCDGFQLFQLFLCFRILMFVFCEEFLSSGDLVMMAYAGLNMLWTEQWKPFVYVTPTRLFLFERHEQDVVLQNLIINIYPL